MLLFSGEIWVYSSANLGYDWTTDPKFSEELLSEIIPWTAEAILKRMKNGPAPDQNLIEVVSKYGQDQLLIPGIHLINMISRYSPQSDKRRKNLIGPGKRDLQIIEKDLLGKIPAPANYEVDGLQINLTVPALLDHWEEEVERAYTTLSAQGFCLRGIPKNEALEKVQSLLTTVKNQNSSDLLCLQLITQRLLKKLGGNTYESARRVLSILEATGYSNYFPRKKTEIKKVKRGDTWKEISQVITITEKNRIRKVLDLAKAAQGKNLHFQSLKPGEKNPVKK